MLPLPFLASDAGAADAAKTPKSATAATSDRPEDGAAFSDVYEEGDAGAVSQDTDSVEENAGQVEIGEETGEQQATDAEESGVTAADEQPDLATVLKEVSPEKAADVTRSTAEDASAFGKTIRALERAAVSDGTAKPETPVLMAANTIATAKEAVQVAQIATQPQVAKMSIEVAEDLAPMRVQVRDTTTPGSAAVQANLQASAPRESQAMAALNRAQVVEPQAETAKPVAQAGDAEVMEEMPLPQARDKAAVAPSAMQWRAQVVTDQVQAPQTAATQVSAEVGAEQGFEAVVSARDEGAARSLTSAPDLPQQARLQQALANPAQVLRQVSEAARSTDKGVIEVTMDPPELGRLRLSMSESAGVMNITISTEQSATNDLMRKHIEMLRRDFIEMGYDNVSFSFEQGDLGGQRQHESPTQTGEAGHTGPADTAEAAKADPVTSPPQQQPTGVSAGLDLRL